MAVPARQSLREPLIGLNCPLSTAAQLALLCGRCRLWTPLQSSGLRSPARELLLKWPNDVLLKGEQSRRHVARDREQTAPNRCKVVIGTGFNLADLSARPRAAGDEPRSPWRYDDAGRFLRDACRRHRRFGSPAGPRAWRSKRCVRAWLDRGRADRAPVAGAVSWRRGRRNLCGGSIRGVRSGS